MEKEVKYRVYYRDNRPRVNRICYGEAYDTLEEAERIFENVRKDTDVSDCHIKRETVFKEIVVQG